MADKSKKRKKGTITEEDAANLLNRYSPQTVLALLKEVSLAAGDKIDWNSMVKNTSTGITCAREYHKLWRHIAYGETLSDRSDTSSDPMDDDGSDLEYEVEAFPPVGREAAVETSACVKVLSQVLVVSAHPSDSSLQENRIIDGPLPINIPNNCGFPTASVNGSQGTNIIISVPIELQPTSTSNGGEKKPKNTKSDSKTPARKKKKPWSEEEDMKLTASVQKYGERNWISISRGDFDNERNPSELSQRWVNLKKQKSNLKIVNTPQHLEAERAAANLATSLAISQAVGDNLKAKTAGVRTLDTSKTVSTSLMNQNQPVRPALPNSTQFPPPNLSSVPDYRVKAAAVAAGARIATSADASSLFEAARAQNVVHITTATGNVMKSSTPSMTSKLPSNVHFVRNGLVKTQIAGLKPNVSRPGEAQQASRGQLTKPSMSKVQTSKVSKGAPVATNAAVSKSSVKNPKTGEDAVASTSGNEKVETAQRELGSDPSNKSVGAQAEQNSGDRTPLLCTQSDAGKGQGSSSDQENNQQVQVSTNVPDPVSETTNNPQ